MIYLIRDIPVQGQIAVAFILERDDKILLGQRSINKDFGGGLWEIPSGRVNVGESLEEAVTREAQEELEVKILSTSLIHSYIFPRNEINVNLLVYYCTFEGEPKISNEHSNLEWVNPQDVDDYFNYDSQKISVKKYLEYRSLIDRK